MKKIILFSLFTLGLHIDAASDKNNTEAVQMLFVNFDPHLVQGVMQAEQEISQKNPELACLFDIEGIVKEAREKYGIPPQGALPLKDMDPASPEARLVAAYVTTDAIVINRSTLQAQSFGARRITLFHEISHEDNNDPERLETTSTAAGFAAATASCVSFLKKTGLGRRSLWALPMAAGAFCVSKFGVHTLHHHHIEHRADVQAIEHAACFQCAKELALERKVVHAKSDWQQEIQESLHLSPLYALTYKMFTGRYLSHEQVIDNTQNLKNKTCNAHQVVDQYPVVAEFIEHKSTVMCNALETATLKLREENKLSRLKRIAELHEQRSEGPLLTEFV